MTEAEFELIDALYFTLSFEQLRKELNWESDQIKKELFCLIEKGWVKVLQPGSEEEVEDKTELERNYSKFLYLASKDGLMAHNSR